nr:hypothetical protein [Salinispora arenicola]
MGRFLGWARCGAGRCDVFTRLGPVVWCGPVAWFDLVARCGVFGRCDPVARCGALVGYGSVGGLFLRRRLNQRMFTGYLLNVV